MLFFFFFFEIMLNSMQLFWERNGLFMKWMAHLKKRKDKLITFMHKPVQFSNKKSGKLIICKYIN